MSAPLSSRAEGAQDAKKPYPHDAARLGAAKKCLAVHGILLKHSGAVIYDLLELAQMQAAGCGSAMQH